MKIKKFQFRVGDVVRMHPTIEYSVLDFNPHTPVRDYRIKKILNVPSFEQDSWNYQPFDELSSRELTGATQWVILAANRAMKKRERKAYSQPSSPYKISEHKLISPYWLTLVSRKG